MERKQFFYWMAQIAGWGAYYVFSILILFTTDEIRYTNNLALWVLLSILMSVFISHGLRFVIIKFNWVGLRLPLLITYSILLAIGGAIVLEFLQELIEYVVPLDFLRQSSVPNFEWALFFYKVSRSLILFMVWLGFYYSFLILERARKSEISNLKYQATQNEIELKNLRAQLNPHFLFNSLNSIRALVGLDPEQAKSAITRLSNLLRQSISLGKMQVISLKQELELVESYLDLEQIRFEERLNVQLDIHPDSKKCNIPPLMLQTVAENAIKHGISKSIEGGDIIIKSRYSNNQLEVEVKNTGKLQIPKDDTGIGVENTQKRLGILYGKDASFNIEQEGDMVKVTIKIRYT